MSRPCYVAGTGTYLPGEPVPFDRIETVLGELTLAPRRIRNWIERTTPVMKELLDVEVFHYAWDPVSQSFSDDNVTMAVKAARIALDDAGMAPGDIDLICYGSAHMDQMPTPSVRIQEQLGIATCDEFSIHVNCTSAYKALYLAHALVSSGRNRNALVVSSNIASSELRAGYYNQEKVDRESLFLRWFLCDGAGAMSGYENCFAKTYPDIFEPLLDGAALRAGVGREEWENIELQPVRDSLAMQLWTYAFSVATLLLEAFAPYHHPQLTRGVRALFTARISSIQIKVPQAPVVSAVDCSEGTDCSSLLNLVSSNLCRPIHWNAVMKQVNRLGFETCFECGPGISLAQNNRFLDQPLNFVTIKNAHRRSLP